MKVPSLDLKIFLIAIDKDGNDVGENWDRSATGCYACCSELEKHFGIKTAPSTVYNGKKRFVPVKYPWGKTKEYYLAYLNWVLNFPPEGRAKFFEDEPDMAKFSENNPIVDIKIVVKKHRP